jgi:hypothetical protein
VKTPALVSERDRFAAASLQVERLLLRLKRRNPGWLHYFKSNAGITSHRLQGR